jgi:oxalate---CoA ligase
LSIRNQKILGGSISKDVFQDASTLEEISADHEGKWRDWSLLASDGDLAVIVQLTSEDKVCHLNHVISSFASFP